MQAKQLKKKKKTSKLTSHIRCYKVEAARKLVTCTFNFRSQYFARSLCKNNWNVDQGKLNEEIGSNLSGEAKNRLVQFLLYQEV